MAGCVRACPAILMFQSAPPTGVRGDVWFTVRASAISAVSIRSPHRSEGRSSSAKAMTEFSKSFNPLPPPE